ncbi:MAG: NADH-quinone oxidoreductase subunit M [Sandaracinaceae bacterium]|nr:NADH-quinone oxidoreductase subunit M [Sandaracinaceae bacterium]
MSHILTLLVAVPMLGALAILFMPRQNVKLLRNFSVGIMLVEFVVSLALLWDPTTQTRVSYAASGFMFVENYSWVESLGISYKVGIDGISLWLILLTTALTPIALFASWQSIDTKIKEFALAFLLLEVGMLGAFVALDLFLFYVFWELMLVPMYLIIGIWGGKDRVYAAVKFFIYTMVGSVLMLIAILYIVAQYKGVSGHYSFDIVQLTRLSLPRTSQFILFAAFGLAFAIKVPMFPFHTWLPDAHVQAPTGGSVILAAVLLKLGCYGFLRFAMPLFPVAAFESAPTLAVFAVIGIIYGAFCAWRQQDVKKLVAYSSVSHLGFVMLGLFSGTTQGISGAILQMVSHGISTGALFLLVGVIYERRHTRDLDAFGGLAKVMPIYTVLFIIVTMSSIGLPGTNGFIGEFMILSSTFSSPVMPFARSFALFAATGVILAAVYMLHAVLKMFWGPVSKKENEHLPDLTRREAYVLAPLILFVFWIGLFPNTFLKPMEPAVERYVAAYVARHTEASDVATLSPDPAAPPGSGEHAENAPTDGPPEARAARGAQ